MANTFRLDESGLRRLLGDLQADIMEVAWREGEVRIRQVWEQIKPERDVTFNTVMTVMNRLASQGLLLRTGLSRGYRYHPRLPREAFIREITGRIASGLLSDFGEATLVHFVDAVENLDPRYLDRLAQLVAARKAERDG